MGNPRVAAADAMARRTGPSAGLGGAATPGSRRARGLRRPAGRCRARRLPVRRALPTAERHGLISTVPDLAASATIHYDAWERAVADFVARRTGQPTDSLFPRIVGRSVLASCRTVYERWFARADADLAVHLEAALEALPAGFADPVPATEPEPPAERG
ncbi:hypothetical protein AB0F91_06050 [Amycolatopsis sp. NPDC023774]|uniref:acyl-CoA-like ligand-binding transcription factor n=1 Tax=Amycolatopsis sp. NPDC023774 TaxID=3155015 RepID=UPI0034023E65